MHFLLQISLFAFAVLQCVLGESLVSATAMAGVTHGDANVDDRRGGAAQLNV